MLNIFDFPYYIILFFSLGILFPFFISGISYIYLVTRFYFFRKNKNFKSKHIIIIGASSGLGEALSLRLSRQGVNLSIASRTEKKLKEVQEKCLKLNIDTNCDYYLVDITDSIQIKNFLEKSILKRGFPSLLINSAGKANPGFLNDLPLEIYEKDMELNYFGNLKIIKEFLQIYKKTGVNKKKEIDIVCVGSCLGIIGSIGYTSYAPTKYALKGLLDSLRYELIETNISLHYFGPSNMDTPGLAQENLSKPKIVLDMENNVKTISADEAADILLSNLNEYMITTEPNLVLLKNCPSFMNPHSLLDIFLIPISSFGIIFSRKFVEKKIIRKNKEKNKNY